MVWLLLGVLLWSGMHGLPVTGRAWRAALVDRVGVDPYRGLFSLALLAAIGLIVLGWRSTVPSFLYTPPPWGRTAANLLMALALFLFVASALPTRVKQVLRHPQLSGVVVWATAHLLANGDQRSLVLFGCLGIWAVAMMFGIDRRDGAWKKPPVPGWGAEVVVVAASAAAFVGVYLAHPWITGVSPAP